MRKTYLIAAAALSCFAMATAAKAGTTFDGQWTASNVCPAYQDALGYSMHLVVLIQNGQLQANFGKKDQPGYLTISGTVADDGTLNLSGYQITKTPSFAVGHVPAGTKEPFTVTGKLDSDSGQGTRTETRPCTYYFNKTAF